MIDLGVPHQMYPDCNIVTKFNIDTDNGFFLINELKFDFITFDMSAASMEWKIYRDIKSQPLKANNLPPLVRYNFQKDYFLVNNAKFNPYNFNLSTHNDFNSQLIINNELVVQQYGTRVVVCTLDGNILPFVDYDLGFVPQFIHFEYDGQYLYVHTIQNAYYRLHVFSNYRNLRNSQIYFNKFEGNHIIDFSSEDKTFTLQQYKYFRKFKYSHNSISFIIDARISNYKNIHTHTNVVKPKTMYNYGIYALATDGALQFLNFDENDKTASAYDVEIDYNGFPEIITSGIRDSICTFIDNEYFDLYVCDDNATYCYRILLDSTSDLKCKVVGYTNIEQSFSAFTRISTTHPELIAGVRDSYTFVILKYIHELNIYEVLESFNTTSLALFTLHDDYTYYISNDNYSSSNPVSIEIKKRKILPVVKLYIDLPELIEQNTESHFTTTVYDILNDKFVKNMPIEFNITNGHFSDGSHTLWFYSQEAISIIDFFSESGNDSIKITYNFKGSQNES